MYRIDQLNTAPTCASVRADDICSQIHWRFAHYSEITRRGWKRVERERGDWFVFKLAALALPINAKSYNHNPPMEEHNKYIWYSAASLSTVNTLYCKISMICIGQSCPFCSFLFYPADIHQTCRQPREWKQQTTWCQWSKRILLN
jgi:hypothetical protein